MIVNFIGRRQDSIGRRVMDAVPRCGDAVTLDGKTTWIVWTVAWQLTEGEQVAWVALRTRQEYKRDLSRNIPTETASEAAQASPTQEPSRHRT